MTDSVVPSAGGRHQRRIKNLLLVPKFQLKYAVTLVAIIAALLAALGAGIMVATDRARDQAEQSVAIAEEAESHAEQAFRESQASARILRMNQIMQSAQDPAVVASLEHELEQVDRQLNSNLARVHIRRAEIRHQRDYIQRLRGWVLASLVLSGLLICVVLFCAAIVITHRIVGPVYRLKRLLHEVGDGSYVIRGKPRAGDELIDLFEAFVAMVDSLRAAQVSEVAELDRALANAEAQATAAEVVAPFRALRTRMNRHLETPS